MSKPLVSIVIPVYNRAHAVGHAIESVLVQTWDAREIIVVDDGSTDATPGILESYAEQIVPVRQDNAGVSAARNRGVQQARGEWIAFLDSDDLWHPEKLSCQMKALQDYQVDVCFARVRHSEQAEQRFDAVLGREVQQRLIDQPLELLLQKPCPTYVQSMVIRKSLLEKIGYFNPAYKVAEDTDLFYKLAFETSFAWVDEPLTLVNRDPQRGGLSQISFARRKDYYQSHLEIISQAYERLNASRSVVGNALRKIIIHNLSALALVYCVEGDYAESRRLARRALSFVPDLRTMLRCYSILFAPQWVHKRHRAMWCADEG